MFPFSFSDKNPQTGLPKLIPMDKERACSETHGPVKVTEGIMLPPQTFSSVCVNFSSLEWAPLQQSFWNVLLYGSSASTLPGPDYGFNKQRKAWMETADF